MFFFFIYSETNRPDIGLIIELWTKGLIWDTLLGLAWVPLNRIKDSNEVSSMVMFVTISFLVSHHASYSKINLA